MTDTAKDMPELKPCPFCGKRPCKSYVSKEHVECSNVECPLFDQIAFRHEAWQTRADLSRPQAQIDREVEDARLTLVGLLEKDGCSETYAALDILTQAATRSSQTGAEGLVKARDALLYVRHRDARWLDDEVVNEALALLTASHRKQTGEA